MYHNAWSGINLNLLISFVPGIKTLKNICLNFCFMSGKDFVLAPWMFLIALGDILGFIFL